MTVRLIEDVARQGAAERPAIETAVSVPRLSGHESAPHRRAGAGGRSNGLHGHQLMATSSMTDTEMQYPTCR